MHRLHTDRHRFYLELCRDIGFSFIIMNLLPTAFLKNGYETGRYSEPQSGEMLVAKRIEEYT